MPQTSAYTSTRQIPALFKLNVLKGINFDFGGGRYDDGTNYLKEQGVTNLVFDPYCREQLSNAKSMLLLDDGVDSITCLNVLNVIKDDAERQAVIRQVAGLANYTRNRNLIFPTVYFQIYEGDRSGIPHPTNSQLNRKTKDYLTEIEDAFDGYSIEIMGSKKNIIKISNK